jgi:type I restriction enzyme R subunit
MYDLVQQAWAEHLADLRQEHDALPELEQAWLASRIALMESTDMAVVVSQAQNEIADLAKVGLHIEPHRARMVSEDLAEKFKDAEDPLRIVFVCAMWMTGFDAPSVSTIYLDRPMRNHSLMQAIARANRVFPDKDNGLIVDYANVFSNLEHALAIYGAASADGAVDRPIEDIEALADALTEAVETAIATCAANGVDLAALREAKGFAYLALQQTAKEALLVTEDVRSTFLADARQARKLFKALLPNPAAAPFQRTVAAIRELAEFVAGKPLHEDLSALTSAVDELLDRSVGAEEYVIRRNARNHDDETLIDLSLIDFEGLSKRFGGKKRSEADRLARLLQRRALDGATQNPTRYDLVARIEELIATYNAGSLNIDEYLRRLIELSKTLSTEEHRAVNEGLSEEELALFDLLTKPEPQLTDGDRAIVKASAKRLLARIHEELVIDWRRKAASAAIVRTSIRNLLDHDLPADPYPPAIFDQKVQAIYDHVATAYRDDGSSVYDHT